MRRWIILVAATALLAAGLTSGANADASGLEQVLIESASTPKQHSALASYYEGKAAAARKEAQEHRSMGKAYSAGKFTQVLQMKEHCEKLAALYDEQAKEFDMLASMHRDAAK